MSDALRMGLMGAAQGFLQGAYQNWQADQEEIRTERLRRARQMEQENLIRIQNNIRPPETRQLMQGNEKVTQEWRVNTEGSADNWSGEWAEAGREKVAPKSTLEKVIKGDEIVTIRRYEDGTEEEVGRGPRRTQGGDGGGSKRAPKLETVKHPETGEPVLYNVDTGDYVKHDGKPLSPASKVDGKADKPDKRSLEWQLRRLESIRDEVAEEVALIEGDDEKLTAALADANITKTSNHLMNVRSLIDHKTAERAYDLGIDPRVGQQLVTKPAQESKPAEDKPRAPVMQGTEQDAQHLMEAARQAIAAGKDPAAVQRKLEQELAKIGFSLGANK